MYQNLTKQFTLHLVETYSEPFKRLSKEIIFTKSSILDV